MGRVGGGGDGGGGREGGRGGCACEGSQFLRGDKLRLVLEWIRSEPVRVNRAVLFAGVRGRGLAV